jgi:hypothetical protein
MMAAENNVPPAPAGWPWPLNEAALHGLAGDIVRTIEPHTESDPAALLTQTLAGFGNVVGRGPHFKVEADRHGTNLFLALVGQTSKARKGTSWGHVGRLLRHVDPSWAENQIQQGLSSGEGLIRSVWDGSSSDPGITDKRLFVFEPEFGGTLGVMCRLGNTLSSTLRQAWDGGILRVLTRQSPLKATGAHISIVTHTTRDDLTRHLGQADRFNGFANRFLWVCVRRSKYLPHGGMLPTNDFENLARRLKKALTFAKKAPELRLSEKSLRLWEQEYPALTVDVPGLLGAVTSRAEAQVSRLAAVYALLECSDTIKTQHLRAALAVWDYCLASAKFIFNGSFARNLEDRLLSMLRSSAGGLTRTQISGALQRHASSDRIDHALFGLSEKGHVEMQTEQSRGRPIKRWLYVAKKKD